MRDVLDELVDAGLGVKANRTLPALKTCFTWLHRRDPDALPRSPCDGIDDPAPETPRERVLTDVELAAVWRAAASEGYPFGHMVRLLMLTGCRRDEVRDAPWSEIDLQAREWSIPARRTKNGRDHLVPIVDQVAAILEKMPRIKGARPSVHDHGRHADLRPREIQGATREGRHQRTRQRPGTLDASRLAANARNWPATPRLSR